VLPADTKNKVTRRVVHVIVEKWPARPLKHRTKVMPLLAPLCVTPYWANNVASCSVYGLSVSCTISFFLRHWWKKKISFANFTNWSFREIPFRSRVFTYHSSIDASSRLKILTVVLKLSTYRI